MSEAASCGCCILAQANFFVLVTSTTEPQNGFSEEASRRHASDHPFCGPRLLFECSTSRRLIPSFWLAQPGKFFPFQRNGPVFCVLGLHTVRFFDSQQFGGLLPSRGGRLEPGGSGWLDAAGSVWVFAMMDMTILDDISVFYADDWEERLFCCTRFEIHDNDTT